MICLIILLCSLELSIISLSGSVIMFAQIYSLDEVILAHLQIST